MNTALIGTSRKENERRVAIHPRHIKNIPGNIRKQLFFEKDYGISFGMSDKMITTLTGNQPLSRKTLFRECKAFIIPKPVEEDYEEMKSGSIVWGWNHSVQQPKIAQIAIDKNMTLVSWENMYFIGKQSKFHIFQKNNEMAGYCGVQHALQLRGIDGNFGAHRKVIVIGFGSVSRGAIFALKAHGFHDITVFTQRNDYLVTNKILGIEYRHFYKDSSGDLVADNLNEESKPLIDILTQADILVNGILQNPNSPVTFVYNKDIEKFKKECLVIDISCDEGMGFSFAKPTTLANPTFKKGNIRYYSMDHTPTLLWDSASWEISNSIIPYLKDFVERNDNAVLNNAIDIREGIILNKDILLFQNRFSKYPYKMVDNDARTKTIINIDEIFDCNNRGNMN